VKTTLPPYTLQLHELRSWAGLGVAGNFAGHLEQAGEAADFVNVTTAESDAPKGIFPFYIPKSDQFLSVFPLSFDAVAKPLVADPAALQIEPEVGLACTLEYDSSGRLTAVTPFAFGAYNDCSIRRPGASKISEKKNWGTASKGVSERFLSLGSESLESATRPFRLACYLRRGDALHPYGIDSPLLGYSYYGDRLLNWIVDTLNTQVGSPSTPLEPVGDYLREAGQPRQALISIGATRYTDLGENTYLEVGDEAIVVVYSGDECAPKTLTSLVKDKAVGKLSQASVLVQRVF
jgi:Family of unknown function (DUF5718)